MPFSDSGFSSGSGRRDVFARKDFFWPISDLTHFILSVLAVFVIEIDVILPGRLSGYFLKCLPFFFVCRFIVREGLAP